MKFKYTQILNEGDFRWECERNIGRKGERRPRARMGARLGHTAREREGGWKQKTDTHRKETWLGGR